MSDPWAHLERNFEAHMDRDRSERDAHLAADEPPPPSPRCDRTRDMFDESRLMDAQQLDALRHALGIGADGAKPAFRNHFVTGEGSDDHVVCMALVERGLMTRRTGSALSGGDDIFSVTAEGRLAAAGTWVPQPRGKQSYANYLHSGSDLEFGEWLKQTYSSRSGSST